MVKMQVSLSAQCYLISSTYTHVHPNTCIHADAQTQKYTHFNKAVNVHGVCWTSHRYSSPVSHKSRPFPLSLRTGDKMFESTLRNMI